MKRIVYFTCISILCLYLTACNNESKVDNAEIFYSSSEKFAETEILAAIDTVLFKFPDFDGCILLKLWYDEETSDEIIHRDVSSGGMNVIKNAVINLGTEPDNIIVLYSDFRTSATSVNDGFGANQIYTDYTWIIIRDSENCEWELISWGY